MMMKMKKRGREMQLHLQNWSPQADTGCSWRVLGRGFRAAGCSFVEGFGPSV